MTLYEFNDFDEMEQIEAIWEAVEIGTRQNREHTITLFQIDDFYIEYWELKNTTICRKITAFKSSKVLNFYLGKVNIDWL